MDSNPLTDIWFANILQISKVLQLGIYFKTWNANSSTLVPSATIEITYVYPESKGRKEGIGEKFKKRPDQGTKRELTTALWKVRERKLVHRFAPKFPQSTASLWGRMGFSFLFLRSVQCSPYPTASSSGLSLPFFFTNALKLFCSEHNLQLTKAKKRLYHRFHKQHKVWSIEWTWNYEKQK